MYVCLDLVAYHNLHMETTVMMIPLKMQWYQHGAIPSGTEMLMFMLTMMLVLMVMLTMLLKMQRCKCPSGTEVGQLCNQGKWLLPPRGVTGSCWCCRGTSYWNIFMFVKKRRDKLCLTKKKNSLFMQWNWATLKRGVHWNTKAKFVLFEKSSRDTKVGNTSRKRAC